MKIIKFIENATKTDIDYLIEKLKKARNEEADCILLNKDFPRFEVIEI